MNSVKLETERLNIVGENAEDCKTMRKKIIGKDWKIYKKSNVNDYELGEKGAQIGLVNFVYKDGKYKIYFEIDEKYRDDGIASEAVKNIITNVFENNRLIRVFGEVEKDNISASRVLIKSGFSYNDDDEIFEYKNRK